jgi:hypothetical protein
MEKKICSKCKVEKDISNFYSDKRKSDGLYSQCKECFLEKNNSYKQNNKEKIKSKRKDYYQSNKSIEIERVKLWQKNNKNKITKRFMLKYNTDILFKLSHNLRRRINQYLIKKNKSTLKILGCTPIFLKEYLEQKFTEGMSWDLMGKYIHIDHIIPLSSAKTEEEVYKLCHYTNLQPLWAKDNLTKSDKIL